VADSDDTRKVPEDFHALYEGDFRAARGLRRGARLEENAGHARMREDMPDVEVSYDDATGLPKLVSSGDPEKRMSEAADTEEEAAMGFVRDRADLWELADEDLECVEVRSVSRRGLKAVRMVQRMEGKEVFDSEVTVSMGKDNAVTNVSGQLFNGSGDGRRRAREAPQTPETAAIAMAASDLTGRQYRAEEFAPAPARKDAGDYRFYAFTPPKDDDRPGLLRAVRLKDVMFPLGEGTFLPAYFMELWVEGLPPFSYVIDCMDTPDEILFRKNLSAHAFSYLVHNTQDALLRPHDGPAPGTPHPTGVPDRFQAPTVPQVPVVTDGLIPGDAWLPDGATETEGNNCIAYADLQRSNRPGPGNPKGVVTAPDEFHHVYDHAEDASEPTNLQASLVGMFFHVNWLHDRWYEAGFDEASGNAQQDNFGRGGIGGDPILAEGNDASGTDNANMATPSDGASPRMQMFEFAGVPQGMPTRTSNFEALITFHEMGHYVTNRLVGDATGLSNQQGRAMGEGWGDFFAICMTSQETDDFQNGVFAAGGWTDLTSRQRDNYYYSIRRYPYSADMTKNPLTFKHIGAGVVLPAGPPRNPRSGGTNSEVHNAGEVWCSALWEVFVALVAAHGHAEAERRVLEYVIGGLKLTPSSPTFTQARDGIVGAVSALDPHDLRRVKAAFAKRGLGKDAVSPLAGSRTLVGVVESFAP
jgi:extracellular elastinolytic metalloproteinase